MAMARMTDLFTSHEAAREVEASGHAATQREACLRAVLGNPGRTSAEIAAAEGFDRYVAARRLPELRKMGFVKNGSARICKIQGRMSFTWWPASLRGH